VHGNTDPRQIQGKDQVPRRSKHPLLTGHTRRAPLVEIRYSVLPSPKRVWKRQPNNGCETSHSACGTVIICNRKQGHCSDCRIKKIIMHFPPIFSEFSINLMILSRNISVAHHWSKCKHDSFCNILECYAFKITPGGKEGLLEIQTSNTYS
jgi:hypothetical protein